MRSSRFPKKVNYMMIHRNKILPRCDKVFKNRFNECKVSVRKYQFASCFYYDPLHSAYTNHQSNNCYPEYLNFN